MLEDFKINSNIFGAKKIKAPSVSISLKELIISGIVCTYI